MGMLNDEPVLCDRLERAWLVQEVGQAIAHCDPPQVFGIHGDWGLGKTSFLHQLQYYLTGECRQQTELELKRAGERQFPSGLFKDQVRVVWFEAWRYQNEQTPIVALLHEIRAQLEWYIKLWSRFKKLSEVSVRGALLSMEDLTRKIGFQTSTIQQEGERWEERHLAAALPSNTLREQLQDAIDKLLTPVTRGKHRRIVVLIDDLDRCNPAAAYKLLEGLKIYLTLPNCVFVLGMNQRIVEDAIGQHVPTPDGAHELRAERAAAYLEKLAQNIWRLPVVRAPKTLLLDWLEELRLPAGQRSMIDEAIGGLRCLPPNPRRLKGFANLIQRYCAKLPPADPAIDPLEQVRQARLMLIVAYTYQFHPTLYRIWESDPSFYRRVKAWVRGEEIDHPVFMGLRRAQHISSDPKAPVPTWRVMSAYPDPVESYVFWIQSLIHTLEQGEFDVSPEDFMRYF